MDKDEMEFDNPKIHAKKTSTKKTKLKQISTEGVNVEFLHLSYKFTTSECTYCAKFFEKDMVVPEGIDSELVCLHCFFWINHSMKNRKKVDGKNGIRIVDYILKCRNDHDVVKCQKNTESGGCFLCEHNAGIPIENIKNHELLTNDTAKKEEYAPDFSIDI